MTQRHLPLSFVASVLCFALATPSKAEENDPSAKAPAPIVNAPKTGRIAVSDFKQLHWSMGKGSFQAEGDVIVRFKPLPPKGTTAPLTPALGLTVLKAQSVDYSTERGSVKAVGGLRLVNPEGHFRGETLDYNLIKQTGSVTLATLNTLLFKMEGKRITIGENQIYTLEDGSFTTCEAENPDYKITAKSLVYNANKGIQAKHITVYAGGTKLFSLPAFRKNIRANSQALPVVPSYTPLEGFGIKYRDSLIRTAHQSLDMNVNLSLKVVPHGYIYYQNDVSTGAKRGLPSFQQTNELMDPQLGILDQFHIPVFQSTPDTRVDDDYTPHSTFYAVVQNRQFSFLKNRLSPLISRLPEIGMRFTNLLGTVQTASASNPANLPDDTPLPLRRMPNTPFLLDVNAGFGIVHELPTQVTSGRLGLRVNFASQPIILDSRSSVRFGLSNWLNVYTRGTVYGMTSPEFDYTFMPNHKLLYGLGYLYSTDAGATPFRFDHRDMRHELRARFQTLGTWGFGYLMRYDLAEMRPFEAEFAITRNLDCLQLGIGYRFVNKQFNFAVNLLPPNRSKIKAKQAYLQQDSLTLNEVAP
ncbi:hypothetical protein LBMAG21_07480 [Armatimonadota bacterium]|nr:hypothetical protein LBMAG21_07480 [Armatimonadota bacterium]